MTRFAWPAGLTAGITVCLMVLLGGAARVQAQGDVLLSPNSTVHIVTAGETEETGDYAVDARGNITMLYAGAVHVGGLSPAQAQVKIAHALQKFYVHPQVVVSLLNAGSYRITGAVRQPAEYPINSPNFTLADAIGRAGGIADRSRLRETTIIRRGSNGRAFVMKLDARKADVQASTIIRRDDDITIPVGSVKMNPLSVLGTALGLGNLFRH